MATLRQLTGTVRELLSQKNFEKAELLCRKILEVKPDAWPVKLLLATTLIDGGRPRDARNLLMDLSLERNDDLRVFALLGQSQLKLGELDQADKSVRKALGLDANNKLARSVAARLMAARKELDPASIAVEAPQSPASIEPPTSSRMTDPSGARPRFDSEALTNLRSTEDLDDAKTQIAQELAAPAAGPGALPALPDLMGGNAFVETTNELDLGDLEDAGVDDDDDQLEAVATQAWIKTPYGSSGQPGYSPVAQINPAPQLAPMGDEPTYVRQPAPSTPPEAALGAVPGQVGPPGYVAVSPNAMPSVEFDLGATHDPVPGDAIPRTNPRYAPTSGRKPLWVKIAVAVVVVVAVGAAALFFYTSRSVDIEKIQQEVYDVLADGRENAVKEMLAKLEGTNDSEGELKVYADLLHAYLSFQHGQTPTSAATESSGQAQDVEALIQGYRAATQGEYAKTVMQVGGSQSSEADYLKAYALWRRGQFDEALELARQAMASNTKSQKYAALTAQVTAESGDLATATRLLKVDGEPYPQLMLAKAYVLILKGENDKATAVASDVLASLTASVAERAQAHLYRAQSSGSVEDLIAAQKTGPSTEAFTMDLVRAALVIGKPEVAEQALETVAQPGADDVLKLQLIANVYFASGNFDKLEGVLEDAASTPRTTFLKGELASARGDLDKAAQFYKEAMRDPDQLVPASMRLAKIKSANNDYKASVSLLQKVFKQAPKDHRVVDALVGALIDSNFVGQAEKVLADAEKAGLDATKLTFVRAKLAFAKKNHAEARRILNEINEEITTSTADYQLLFGAIERIAGSNEKARAAYEKAIAKSAGDVGVLGLAHALLDAGDVEKAQEIFGRLSKRVAESPDARFVSARISAGLGQGKLAVEPLNALKSDFSVDSWYWSALAMALVQAESAKDAESAAKAALKIDRHNPEAHIALALAGIQRGSLSQAQNGADSAIKAVKRRELGPIRQAQAVAEKARARFNLGGLSVAAQLANDALKLDPQSAEAHFVLGVVAQENRKNPAEHFKASLEGHLPTPEAIGLYLPHASKTEKCELGTRYLKAAPRGFDASVAKKAAAKCK